MVDDARHGEVLDSLLDMQAKLRGDDMTRRLDAVHPRADEVPASSAPPVRDAPGDVAVRRGDLEVRTGPRTDAERLAALADRLKRVERELAQAMDRLQAAETRFILGDDEEPDEAPEDSELDRQRAVYRRVSELQDLAANRDTPRRR